MKQKPKDVYFFSLYVCGSSPQSPGVISTLKHLCADHLAGRCRIKIVDLEKKPEEASKQDIVAIPTLIKTKPLPERRFVGGLANTKPILHLLGIT